ncbi:MAG: hypothetical protein H6722_27455 [Sandaracinus sp.]|nr:hypothetical protein [Myxococcales bacterium]MCB9616190.1 hypothetical protein [Sandaracinus sp.]
MTTAPLLDRRLLLRALVPGAVVGSMVGAGVLAMMLSTPDPIAWWFGGLGAVGLTVGCSAVGLLVRLSRLRTPSSVTSAAQLVGLLGIVPASFLLVWGPVLAVEPGEHLTGMALSLSFSLAGLGFTAASAWLRWRSVTAVSHPT